jgi:hypothetical protein
MAINIEQAPYGWTARGQKIVYRVSSNQIGQPNFKYGVEVTRTSDGKVFDFICEQNPTDGKLYFDLQPLVKLTNMELSSEGDVVHFTPTSTQVNEALGYGYDDYSLVFAEWWNVGGILTQAGVKTTKTAFFAFNAYLQPMYGFRPNPETAVAPVKFAMATANDFAWSDRWVGTTRKPDDLPLPNDANAIYVPAYNTDWGAMAVPIGKSVMASNEAQSIQLIANTGGGVIVDTYTYTDAPFTHIGIYPQNLNIGTGGFKPALYPNWQSYQVFFRSPGLAKRSRTYVFYNAELYGSRNDCRFEYMRIGWVGTRGGWDYFTFIKRSEWSVETERKQYERLIEDGTSAVFDPGQRQYIDREVAVTRTLTLTTDWLEENEFIYLRNMFASRQMVLLNTPQTTPVQYALGKPFTTPITLMDKTLVEQRGRNGKLVNVTIKIKVAQDYWS